MTYGQPGRLAVGRAKERVTAGQNILETIPRQVEFPSAGSHDVPEVHVPGIGPNAPTVRRFQGQERLEILVLPPITPLEVEDLPWPACQSLNPAGSGFRWFRSPIDFASGENAAPQMELPGLRTSLTTFWACKSQSFISKSFPPATARYLPPGCMRHRVDQIRALRPERAELPLLKLVEQDLGLHGLVGEVALRSHVGGDRQDRLRGIDG